ncbi:hypothetical protein ACKKBG_A09825 [Auxenochlorella protothecoides x Auxenochlorella symbiontica]
MPSSESDSQPSGSAAQGKKESKWHKRFVQQRLRGWSPILHARNAELYFLAVGVFCLALGIPILVASLNVVEYKARYDLAGVFADLDSNNQQELLWGAGDEGVLVMVEIEVTKRMTAPIYVVYELDSMFQNYRRYVRSFDPDNMHDGLAANKSGVSACEPFTYITGAPDAAFPNQGAILPCGQISQSLFNDTFELSARRRGGAAARELPINSSDIAWASDREHLYGPVNAENFNTVPALRGGRGVFAPLNQDQHWMVWQRPAAQAQAQKLYGRIDSDLEADMIVTVLVYNRYNTYGFQGAKSLILTTNSWVGGKNVFLGSVYIVIGGLAWLAAASLFITYNLGLFWKRGYGDLSLLSWEVNGKGAMPMARTGSAPPGTPSQAHLQPGDGRLRVQSRNRAGEHRVVPQ